MSAASAAAKSSRTLVLMDMVANLVRRASKWRSRERSTYEEEMKWFTGPYNTDIFRIPHISESAKG